MERLQDAEALDAFVVAEPRVVREMKTLSGCGNSFADTITMRDQLLRARARLAEAIAELEALEVQEAVSKSLIEARKSFIEARLYEMVLLPPNSIEGLEAELGFHVALHRLEQLHNLYVDIRRQRGR